MQLLPVSAVVAPVETIVILFFCLPTSCTARAVEEFGKSITVSTTMGPGIKVDTGTTPLPGNGSIE